jgi:hypothetical protein
MRQHDIVRIVQPTEDEAAKWRWIAADIPIGFIATVIRVNRRTITCQFPDRAKYGAYQNVETRLPACCIKRVS